MKYIDGDKIRSEVERIQETGCESPISVCNDILSFIDFLQQEQPFLPSNLDETVEKEFNNIWDSDLSGQCDTIVAKKVARYFYRLGISHNLQLPSSFEEARDKANFEEPHSLNAYIAFEEAFKAGAEWMAGQGWIDDGSMPPEHKDVCTGHMVSDRVLAWDSMYDARVDFTINGKWASETRGGYTGQVCHGIVAWRPIPEYKEKQ